VVRGKIGSTPDSSEGKKKVIKTHAVDIKSKDNYLSWGTSRLEWGSWIYLIALHHDIWYDIQFHYALSLPDTFQNIDLSLYSLMKRNNMWYEQGPSLKNPSTQQAFSSLAQKI